jgi:hypothetical protein
MKAITFRPLRRVKKTGKIVVAAYTQWNRLHTSDFRGAFSLTIDDEYKGLPEDEHVYNHEGKPLFWRDFDPASLAVYDFSPIEELFDLQAIRAANPNGYGIRWRPEATVNYSHRSLDCGGIPTFSHYTIDYVAEHKADFTEYEPLTVGVVVKWLGWILYNLENSSLQIGK